MSDAPAFFRAIEADPDDDTPRLVYADWLDEHAEGESDRARAEFIRVQCELDRGPELARKAELEARERELLRLYLLAWTGAWSRTLDTLPYRRGFLDPVSIAGQHFGSPAHALSELTPLFHLKLLRVRDAMSSVAACPQLAFVRRLSLHHAWVRNAEMTAFAASPHLGNLQSLELSQNQVGIKGATDLAVARMPSLRELRLERNPLKDRGLLALAQADWPALEGLDASECELTSAGVIGLAEGPLAPRLVSLRLSRNPRVTTAAWVRLVRAPFSRLQRLDLGETPATDEIARAILDSPYLRGLTLLRLPTANLGLAVHGMLRMAFGAGFNPA